jgi:hypothetical protein
MQKPPHPTTKSPRRSRERLRRPRTGTRRCSRGAASGEVIVICAVLVLGAVGAAHILSRGVEVGLERLGADPLALVSGTPRSNRVPAASPTQARASSAVPPAPTGHRASVAGPLARGVELSPVSNTNASRGRIQLAQAFDPILPPVIAGPTPREETFHSEMELNGGTELDAAPFGTGDVRNLGPCPVQVIPRGGAPRVMPDHDWFRLSPGDRLRVQPGCGGTQLLVPTPTS